jgi:hypothetical protein
MPMKSNKTLEKVLQSSYMINKFKEYLTKFINNQWKGTRDTHVIKKNYIKGLISTYVENKKILK